MSDANSPVMGDVLREDGRLLDLSEEQVPEGLIAMGSERRERVAVEVVEDEAPLRQGLHHPRITLPTEVSNIVESIHLAHVILSAEMDIDHTGNL